MSFHWFAISYATIDGNRIPSTSLKVMVDSGASFTNIDRRVTLLLPLFPYSYVSFYGIKMTATVLVSGRPY